jgi:hypothetical protein
MNENTEQKKSVADSLREYKEKKGETQNETKLSSSIHEAPKFNKEAFEQTMTKETDPDLMTSFETVKLPSKGLFYSNGLSEVNIEYLTSKDEDLLTTPSLIENGTVLDVLLKRKIKTPGVNPDSLLPGDRNAVILFLRTSSYGADYAVQVTDPRNGNVFKTSVNLLKLKYKEFSTLPDQNGFFQIEIPMRKKIVTFRLLTSGEENKLFKKAEALKEEYNQEYSDYNTMKLKSHIVAIDEKSDRSYINKFVDAMPALDAVKIRRKIIDVSPDVDMLYEFTTKDGFSFSANLSIGIDFFFPSL